MSNVTRSLAVAIVIFVLGSTNAHAQFCNLASKTVAKLSAGAATVTVAGAVGLKAFGIMALPHISGSLIAATASGTYITGTLGVVGAGVSILTAPATIVIGGVALAAAGGTIAICGL